MAGKKAKNTSALMQILITIVIPVIVLQRFSGPEQLGAVYGLIAALAFPVGYALYDFRKRGGMNFFAALGFVSVLLTGVIGLFELNKELVAIKEAVIPAVIAVAVLLSQRSKTPLLKKFLSETMDFDAIERGFERKGTKDIFDAKLRKATYLLAGAFGLSAMLNFILARIIIQSEPGTTAFNAELGRMTALSFPVIALPMMIIVFLVLYTIIRAVEEHSDISFEDIKK